MDLTQDHETGIKYKVWVEVERIDYDNGTEENIGEPEELGCFSTEEEAIEHVINIQRTMDGWQK